jgi:hypothetical protein
MNKRLISVLIVMAAVFAVALYFLIRKPVHIVEMSESAVPAQYGLPVGPSLLGWSHAWNTPPNRTGYIMMRDVRPTGGNRPLWEFALTSKRHLTEVTREDLRCEFYGMDDPRGTNVFGTAWYGSSILVPEGQVFFARLVSDRSVVYVVRLAKQDGTPDSATMQIEYRAFTKQPPNQIAGANVVGHRSFTQDHSASPRRSSHVAQLYTLDHTESNFLTNKKYLILLGF